MITFAFIDGQNLHLAIKDQGWTLNYARLRRYLKEKYGVSRAFIFIGYIPKNKHLYQALENDGYILIFKPILYLGKGEIKGNVDVDLAVHCMIEFSHFEKAIIVSGDGDFYCLFRHLIREKKLLKILIPNKKRFSTLLRHFQPYLAYISDIKNRLL